MASSTQTPGERLPPHWKSPLAPTSLAFYATWLAVAYGPLSLWLQGHLPDSGLAHAGLAALLALLLLFVARATLDIRPGIHRNWPGLALILQIPAALTACAAFNDGLQPALLIPVVAQIALGFGRRFAVILILVTDFAFAWILLHQPSWRDTPGLTDSAPSHVALLVAYLGFQIFAICVAVFARRAEEAREEALRVNAELLATRELLQQGTRSDERLRLSRELHDLTGHKLTALKMQLALRRRQAPSEDSFALENCERLAEELLADIRGVVTVLRPHEGVDLQRALRALDPGLPRPEVLFDLDPELRVADMRSAEVLLRCAQEGLTNAMRHSAATSVSVSLARAPEGLLLAIADDGNGRVARLRAGNGLRGLRERLEDVGGRLQISDRQPTGLVLQAILPQPQAVTLAVAETPAC